MPISFGKKRKYDEAIAALFSSKTVLEAATKAGISHATLTRWLKLPEFIELYSEAKKQLMQGTINKLIESSFDAAKGLVDIANDTEAAASARVTAWRSVLEFAFKSDENEFIKSKLEELEKTNSSDSASGWIE
jgi:hypothetical protein